MSAPIRLEYGIVWVRTDCVDHELEQRRGDLSEMASLADDVNAAALDLAGVQVCMQPNGWAACPPGADPAETMDAIDRALAAVLEWEAA